METTIRISESVKKHLDKMKIYERESYNDVIEVLLEDHKEVNEKTKKELEEARKHVKEGKVVSHEEVMKRYGL
ncbi:MAG: antitoxin VapB family protein [Nanoarchaeota archaeon]